MLKFFLRFYIVVSITLILSLIITGVVFEKQYHHAIAQDHIRMTQAVNKILGDRLQNIPPEDWLDIIEKIETEYSFHINLFNKSFFDESHAEQLKEEGVFVNVRSGILEDDVIVYYPSPRDDTLIAFTPSSNFNYSYNFLLGVFLACILFGFALSVLMLAWPIIRHINKMVNSSLAIGSGNFSVKADESAPAPLNRLAEAINLMSEQICELMTKQEILTSSASHEFRTPITRLRFALDIASRIDNPDELKRHIEAMNWDVEQLENLTTELLTYSKFSYNSASLHKKAFLLQPLLNQIKQKLQDLKPESEILINCEPDVEITGCVNSLFRAISNLVSNAQKYGKSYIEILVNTTPSHIEIHVIDDGDGICESEREAVLLPFHRLDNHNSDSVNGSGLGLTIVSKIVSAHGGKFAINSNHLNGTTASLLLPR